MGLHNSISRVEAEVEAGNDDADVMADMKAGRIGGASGEMKPFWSVTIFIGAGEMDPNAKSHLY